ncbi:MAG: DUF2341 domain-containing protein [Patescibacteria group bacterium]|nr:DUF2341 domain-containing protein [Patescibacteria group bacterium]
MFLVSKLRILFILIIVLGFFSTPITQKALASADWLDASWSYRRKITIDYTKVGGGLEDESNFPVLISLTGLSNINTNGTDIRFTSSDGTTQLPREIESYSSGALVAWVKIPTLSYTTDTVIYVYYGNSSATEPAANSTYGSQNVWTNNFAGVWHLKETGSGAAGDYKDSTSNSNNSTNTANQPTVTSSGQIGSAESFNGTSNYISVGNGSTLNPAQFTADFWVNTSTYGVNWNVFLAKELWNTAKGWFFYRAANGDLVFTRGGHDTPAPDIQTAITNGWHHVVGTYDGTTLQLWVDGSSGGTATVPLGVADTVPLFFGSRHQNDGSAGNLDYGNGVIDEVNLSSTARSAGWITTEYNNQNSPSTFISAADQETYVAPTPTPTPTSSSSSSSSSSTGTVSAPSCNDSAPIGILDLFQIDAAEDKATLHFTTVTGASGYQISYGLNPDASSYGDKFDYQGSLWTLERTINNLAPNTTYYFKVQAVNGCNGGGFSKTASTTTGGGQKTINQTNQTPETPAKVNLRITAQTVSQIPVVGNVVDKKIEVKKSEITSKPNFISYVVQQGDNLWSIATNFFGQGAKFTDIIAQNKKEYPSLENSPDLTVGWKLNIDTSKIAPEEIAKLFPEEAPKKPSYEKPGYNLDVKVLADSGAPLSGVKVTLHSTPTESITNQDGIAHFSGVAGGKHQVFLSFNGYNGGGQAINVTGDNKNIQLTMQIQLTNGFSSPKVLIVIGGMGAVILVLLFIILRRKKRFLVI